jgi:glycosyltransferase involved in cell wall biosynthesis
VFVDHFSDRGAVPTPVRAGVRRALDALAAARIANIVGVSNFVRDRARARFGKRAGFVETIYGGVDVARFARRREAIGAGVALACVANLIPEKGLDVLLRAMARLADRRLRLTIAGDGPEAGPLKRVAADLGLSDQVLFCGLRDDIDRLLLETDIFVHPALWQEAFGLTVAEAMASECAVVASRVGALPELIVHDESGLLVPPGDVEALTSAMRRLIADPDLRSVLGRNARVRVAERFRIEESIRRHLDLCEAAAR